MRDLGEGRDEAGPGTATGTGTDDIEAVWRLGAALSECSSSSDVLRAIRDGAARSLGAARCEVVVLAPAADVAGPAATARVGTAEPSATLIDEVVRIGLPVLVASRDDMERRFPGLSAGGQGLGAWAALPIGGALGAATGAIALGWSEPQVFSRPQVLRMELVGQLAGMALDLSLLGGRGGVSEPQSLETMPSPFFSLDPALNVTYVNAEAERVLRVSRRDLVGTNLFDAFPRARGGTYEMHYARALQTGRPVTFEVYLAPLDRWFEVRVWPDRRGLNVSFWDVTERHAAVVERTEALSEASRAHARLAFLSDLSIRLSRATTPTEVFEQVGRSVVPLMADWGTIVVPKGEELVRISAFHRDPALDRLANRLVGSYPHPFDGPSPGVVAYKGAEQLRLDRLAAQIIADLDDSRTSAAYGRTLELLGDGPGLITPVVTADGVIAVLTVVRADGAAFDDADAATVTEAASLIGAAHERAARVETDRAAAAALQAAALPRSLPRHADTTFAAGYRPASKGSQVGGDWYDAFELPSGRVAIVVGDAVGHDPDAAALMAQLRNALRAYLFASLGPMESLAQLRPMMAAQEPDAFATIICLELDPSSGEGRWCSAGHPAPILVGGDGISAHLRGRPLPPIGSPPAADGHVVAPEHGLHLRPGDRLLLFTDGLVERRGIDFDVGLAHLMILAEQTYGYPTATQACERILDEMLSESHDDDACLLIVDMAGGPYRS